MRMGIVLRTLFVFAVLWALAGCGGGSSSTPSPTPTPQGSAQVSISLHDMPPAGVTVLSFQAMITGISMQPGNISLLNSPMTLEITHLQGMSAYMATVSVPAGNYTGMTITLGNAQMTFLNDTGSTMGGSGMMGGSSCANGQVCQFTPTMMASSVTISGSPFPMDVQANTPMNLQMDFDLMDSLQSNMGMNPTMTAMMQQEMPASNMFDVIDDMIGQVASVNTSSNQFTMSFMQGLASMTFAVDSNTTFEDFDSIGKPNSIAGLAQGQLVLVKADLLSAGTLHADKVRFETANPQVLDGMVVAISSSTQFDMVVMNEAPAFQGVNVGDVVRMNLQAGTMFDIDDMDLPVSGMSFANSSDMMVGQMVQIEPTSTLVSGTPPQLNTDHVRLMKTWVTATVASKIDANTFMLNNLPGMFGSAGMSSMTIDASAQTTFENVSGVAALNVGDSVSVRGPMFMANGTATFVASKVVKR